MTPVPGVLLAQMDPPAGPADAFDAWYEREHIPSRLAINGFERATRYRALDGEPSQLVVYELSDVAALASPEYRLVKEHPSETTARALASLRAFMRFTGEQIHETAGLAGPAPTHLALVAFSVPERDVAEFDDYYNTEHIPALLKARDWLRVRRYRVMSAEGARWTHLAFHDLGSSAVMRSPERAAARSGPKRAALARRSWFGAAGRWLYQAISSQP